MVLKIRLNSGQTVYQFAFDGITPYTDALADRKLNVVTHMETSSLISTCCCGRIRKPWEIWGWIPDLCRLRRRIPIRVEDVGVVGAIAAAGANHVADHDLLVKCISKYLHIDEVPRIRAV